MMKRSYGIHLLIAIVLGMCAGNSLILTIQNVIIFGTFNIFSIFYGVESIVATVACVLNILCGYDKGEKK